MRKILPFIEFKKFSFVRLQKQKFKEDSQKKVKQV